MIKTEKLNEISVYPFWNDKRIEKKTVKKEHSEITPEPYPNIVLCGRKKSGKTTTALFLIFRFITNKTKLVIFSPDLQADKENNEALNLLRELFGEDCIKIYPSFANEHKNIFLEELDSADERFAKYDTKNSKHLYPTTIFFFDDLGEDDLRSKEIGQLAQNNRHYGCLNIYSSQDWLNFEPKIRNNADLVLLWPGISKPRLKSIFDEIQLGITFDNFVKMYNKCFDAGLKNFMYINLANKEIHKNFSDQLYIK